MDKRVSDDALRLYHSYGSEGAARFLNPCKSPKSEGRCRETNTENWYRAEDVDEKIAQLRAQLDETRNKITYKAYKSMFKQLEAAEAKIERVKRLACRPREYKNVTANGGWIVTNAPHRCVHAVDLDKALADTEAP